jgi:hypothetical protein
VAAVFAAVVSAAALVVASRASFTFPAAAV